MVAAFALLLGLAAPALAVTATMGNAAISRTVVDTFVNFTVIDTNNPSPFDGWFTEVSYYAHRAGDMRFVVVDASGTVTWVSDQVTVAAAGPGTLELGEPAGVTAGSNLGVYSVGAGVISYDAVPGAAPIMVESFNAGLPAVGDPIEALPTENLTRPQRVYSMSAAIHASSPAICKDGGWESYGYRNQGQCIASIVANANSGH